MMRTWVEWLLLIPTIGGSVYAILSLLSVIRFRMRPVSPSRATFVSWPPVTETNYCSGEDYEVEFLSYRFQFNQRDFEERVIAAAVKLANAFVRGQMRR